MVVTYVEIPQYFHSQFLRGFFSRKKKRQNQTKDGVFSL